MKRGVIRSGRGAAVWGVAAVVALAVSECNENRQAGADRAAVSVEAKTVGAVPTTQRFAKFTTPSTKPFAPLADQKDLENAHVVTGKIISGAQPENDASFALLRDLGVKTIVSVDGAAPDVEAAHRYGMRYVHLPIGYDGVSEGEGMAIAKALNEFPGPIYVHCHHGKHRSAAAVAVACVNNGMLGPEQAEDVLKTFGTGVNYKGLWKDARQARRVDDAELAGLKVEWVERAKIAELADAMVKVDVHSDHLKFVQKAGWKTPAEHPDLDPAHEALQLQEHFTEIGRTGDAKARPAGYVAQLTAAEGAAGKLREALAARPVDAKAADAAFKSVAASCTSCHRDFRD